MLTAASTDILAGAAHVVLDSLLGLNAEERVAVVDREQSRSPFRAALRAALEARGTPLRIIALPARGEHESIARLEAELSGLWPDALIELAAPTLIASDPVRRFIACGGRALSLAGISDAFAARVIAPLRLAEVRSAHEALVARLALATRITIVTGEGRARFTLDLDPRSGTQRLRRALGLECGSLVDPPPIPAVRCQRTAPPGLISFLGRGSSMSGRFVAQARIAEPGIDLHKGPPLELTIERGLVVAADGPLASSFARPRRIEEISIGFLPHARFDGDLDEARRVAGAVSLTFGTDEHPIAVVASDATLYVDGYPVIDRGHLTPAPAHRVKIAPRAARFDGLMRPIASLVRPLPVRRFDTEAGRLDVVGSCCHEGAWLARLCGRALGQVTHGRAPLGFLRGTTAGADLLVCSLDGARLAAEGLRSSTVAVPGLIQQELPLDAIRARGLDGLKAGSNAANDLRVMRKERLAPRSRPLDDAALNRFYDDYYVPQLRERYGSLAGFASRGELAAHVGSAELLEVLRDGVPIAATILRCDGARAALIQSGLLHGDQSLRKARALAATYVFGALRAVELGATILGFGGSLPFLRDGVLAFKAKWNPTLTLPAHAPCYRVAVRLDTEAGRRLLERSPLIAIDDRRQPVGIALVTPTTALERLGDLLIPGLRRLTVLLDGIGEDRIRAALEPHAASDRVRCVPLDGARWGTGILG